MSSEGSGNDLVFFTFMGRSGAAQWSFPAPLSSSCHHTILSAPAIHKGFAGPGSCQRTPECGKWDRWVLAEHTNWLHYEFCFTEVFKCVCLPLPQLDHMCLDKRLALGDVTMTESQKQNIQAILDLLEKSGQVESIQVGQSTSVLTALHLISSAMDGEKSYALRSFNYFHLYFHEMLL